jgi:quercetin dioxygenase-like cupin family protein
MFNQAPILSSSSSAPILNLGETKLAHLIPSSQTDGRVSVVEFIAEPGKGVGLHVHAHEEELVYLLQGQIEVTLGGQKMTVHEGACAMLPRNIPHGFVNTGTKTVRLLAVLLPGKLDEFFVKLNAELATEHSHEAPISALATEYGLTFPEA